MGGVLSMFDLPQLRSCRSGERCVPVMEESSDCIGPKLAPFNPTGHDAIRVAVEMLQVTKVVARYVLVLRRTLPLCAEQVQHHPFGLSSPDRGVLQLLLYCCSSSLPSFTQCVYNANICTSNKGSLTHIVIVQLVFYCGSWRRKVSCTILDAAMGDY